MLTKQLLTTESRTLSLQRAWLKVLSFLAKLNPRPTHRLLTATTIFVDLSTISVSLLVHILLTSLHSAAPKLRSGGGGVPMPDQQLTKAFQQKCPESEYSDAALFTSEATDRISANCCHIQEP